MNLLLLCVANTHQLMRRLYVRVLMHCYKCKFKKAGPDVKFDPIGSNFSYKNISIGNHVFIASSAWFSSDRAQITIGSYVMFGPGVKILGGDHEFKNTQVPMYLVTEKRRDLDVDVIIGDDVWIGANAVILKGVKIGSGAIVASGSVVTKDVEPFCVSAGIPARKVKNRFTDTELAAYRVGAGKYLHK